MTNKTEKISLLFRNAQQRFLAWLEHKPTGKFSMDIPVNEGGVRDKPEYNFKVKG